MGDPTPALWNDPDDTPIVQLAKMLHYKGVGTTCPPYTFADQLLRLYVSAGLLPVVDRLNIEDSLDNLDVIMIVNKIKELTKK